MLSRRATLSASFTPSAPGPRKSSISISDNATGSPHTIILTGVGTAVSLAPPSVTFPNQNVGTSSAPQVITLTNLGSAILHLWQTAIGGTNAEDFSETTTCGRTLAARAGCTVSVTFTPTTSGTRTASALFSDDGGGSPQAVGLAGTGSVTAGSASLSTTKLSFGGEPVGRQSSPQTVVLTNTGKVRLTIGRITVAGSRQDFLQTNNCGAALEAGAKCAVKVVFRPQRLGPSVAKLILPHDGAGPSSVDLWGTGSLH
ncbi:MAG: choice-of-anchor D domain-containing protein [Terriglobia bacterium]